MNESTSGAHIVAIDNEENLRLLFAACLTRPGWTIAAFSYPQMDVAALKQLQPDLIILDFGFLDGGEGWEFLQLLKMDDDTARIPILITTTNFELSLEIRSYLSTRYIFVVHKPFGADRLVRAVQQTLLQASQARLLFSSDRILPILLVEDREELRDGLSLMLNMEGYQVVVAENGFVALQLVSRADYCLILLDISMPVMNGYEFLAAYDRQLRPHSPVIIVSAEAELESDRLPSFVVGSVSKPYQLASLLNAVVKFAPSS